DSPPASDGEGDGSGQNGGRPALGGGGSARTRAATEAADASGRTAPPLELPARGGTGSSRWPGTRTGRSGSSGPVGSASGGVSGTSGLAGGSGGFAGSGSGGLAGGAGGLVRSGSGGLAGGGSGSGGSGGLAGGGSGSGGLAGGGGGRAGGFFGGGRSGGGRVEFERFRRRVGVWRVGVWVVRRRVWCRGVRVVARRGARRGAVPFRILAEQGSGSAAVRRRRVRAGSVAGLRTGPFRRRAERTRGNAFRRPAVRDKHGRWGESDAVLATPDKAG